MLDVVDWDPERARRAVRPVRRVVGASWQGVEGFRDFDHCDRRTMAASLFRGGRDSLHAMRANDARHEADVKAGQ